MCTDNERAVTLQLPRFTWQLPLFTWQLPLFTLSCYLQVNDPPITMYSQGVTLDPVPGNKNAGLRGAFGPYVDGILYISLTSNKALTLD